MSCGSGRRWRDRLGIDHRAGYTSRGVLPVGAPEEAGSSLSAVMNMLDGLQDYSPKRIDDFYKKNDVKFAKENDVTKRFDATFGLLVSLNDTTLKDTIFSRPPIFFSLFLILDDIKNKIKVPDLRDAMGEMDARYESEKKTKADTKFYVACSSNPHRINSREKRDQYIRGFIE